MKILLKINSCLFYRTPYDLGMSYGSPSLLQASPRTNFAFQEHGLYTVPTLQSMDPYRYSYGTSSELLSRGSSHGPQATHQGYQSYTTSSGGSDQRHGYQSYGQQPPSSNGLNIYGFESTPTPTSEANSYFGGQSYGGQHVSPGQHLVDPTLGQGYSYGQQWGTPTSDDLEVYQNTYGAQDAAFPYSAQGQSNRPYYGDPAYQNLPSETMEGNQFSSQVFRM